MAQKQILKQESSVYEVLSKHKKQLTRNIEQHTDERHMNTLNHQSNLELSISQIIRTNGKKFTQIR
ncbi:MAG: hypothetical protein QOA08_10315, partial [Nitrososphaeraceae archaeon]|nr:hypothetical protein [Nitrososphaeraceae archaeon]